MQQSQPNDNYILKPSLNMDSMQQQIPNLDDISDPITTMNMALVLMAKAFKLNYSTPNNNNQRSSSNPRNRQIAQPGINIGQDRQMLMVGENGGNQFRQLVIGQKCRKSNWYNAGQIIGNQIRMQIKMGMRNGSSARNCHQIRIRDAALSFNSVVNAQKKEAWGGGGEIQLQAEEFYLMAATGDIDEIEEVNANCILMKNLQQASTSGTQTDKAPVYDSDGSAEAKSCEEVYFSNTSKTASVSNTVSKPFSIHVDESSDDTPSVARKFLNELNLFETSNLLQKEAEESLDKITVLENENEHLLRAIVSQDIMSIVQRPTIVETSDLQTELEHTNERFENYNTTKTRRLQPRSNTKNYRVTSASKSSCIKNKEVEVDEHHRNLLLSKNQKHMSSECNNIKLAIQNDKSKFVCAMCKQCLITANHDVCVLNYVNEMNSYADNQNANVSNVANQKKHKPKGKKPKKSGSKESLATPKPRKPKTCLRWSPTGRIFYLKGILIESSDSECQSDCSKGYPNFFMKFLGTVRFGNDHVAVILGYGDLQWGNILIARVYYIECLGHNLFLVGQFCDSNLE
ncbi:hypothetical protein Tco_0826108, partial [Tanacetum coccineum]